MSEFTGKIVVITGAGSGIGRATALLFAREGAKVSLIDQDDSSGRATAELISRGGGEGFPLRADVSSEQQLRTALESVVARYGHIDVLFANTTAEEWDRLHSVNLRGVFLCCKYVIPVMQKRGGGNIIISSSGHAFHTYPNCSAYAATKGGLLAFMRGAAIDYAVDGIRVNCIIPGATDTPLLRNYLKDCPDPVAEEKRIVSGIPLKRFASPEDLAKAVRFLASSDASYITGTWLAVDGGLLAQG